MEFDFSWKKPTEAQVAALEHAHRCLGGKDLPPQDTWHTIVLAQASGRAHMVDCDRFDYKLNGFDLAEMMLTADGSLWYTQAKAWEKGDTPECEERGKDVIQAFQLAGVTAVAIVEWGYQDGKWWDLEQIFPHPAARAMAVISLIEAVRLVDFMNTPTSAGDMMLRAISDDVGTLLSQGWRLLPKLLVPKLNMRRIKKLLPRPNGAALAIGEVMALFDPAFRKKLSAVKRGAKAKLHETYEPTECIHPECKNLVGPTGIKPREGHHKNYRGTGACRQGHNSYFCTKCQAPHSFVSKIGRRHYPEHYGKDWDGLDMEGNKWSA